MSATPGEGADDDSRPAVQVRGIDHVGVAVPDLDAAARFFRTVFGLTLVHREQNADQGVDEAFVTAQDGGPPLQLLAPLGPDTTIGRFLERRGAGLQQLALRVDDVDAAIVALRAAGIVPLFDPARPGTDGSRVTFVHPRDAFGVLVELVEARQQQSGGLPH